MSLFAAIFATEQSFTMELFLGIGFIGLMLLVLQVIIAVFIGHDGDVASSASVDLHGGHGGGLSIVSLKTITGMCLGFGFGGALFEQYGFSSGIAALGGTGIGAVIGAIYFWMMHSLYKLKCDGTSQLAEAVDRSGTVYMRIPGTLSGAGEIQISFGGRMQNVCAYTRGVGLATGTAVKVIGLHGDSALLVEKL
ncbi:MAG TPA: hypothetical protein VHY09_15070 [Candidatus Methylacidiphilales bacterium]|nr:hypothetical protein [Candidatus Methylacidiphilales bacterium]